MNKKKLLTAKQKLMLILLMACFLVIFVMFVFYLRRDQNPPEITFDLKTRTMTSEEVQELEKKNYDCLLTDVEVVDDTDGDIKDRLIVSGYRKSSDGVYAIVVYEALDWSGNATTTRRVIYLKSLDDLTAPVISYSVENKVLTDAEVEQVLNADFACLLGDVQAIDETDGDLSHAVTIADCKINGEDLSIVIKYQVSDTNDNFADVERIIYLQNSSQYEKIMARINQ